jgi:hypothetical protein
MEKAVNVRDIQSLLAILDAAVKQMETTINPDLIFALAEALQGMNVEDVEFVTLPGEDVEPAPGQPWYYIMDEDAAATLFENIELYCSVITPEEQAALQAEQEQKEQAIQETDRSTVDLAVLNGVRWEGMAAQVAEIMEDKGYVGVSTGNTVNPYSKTTVYYAPGHEAEARLVAQDLDPEATFVVEESEDVAITYDAAVILVIGKDYVSE